MATVDPGRDEIVIRIVYDGPPLAGKTTSLVALNGMLAARRRSEVFTPAESGGRTLWFDWMDYLGGWCDGYQVRCQLVTVPGQRSLSTRRRLLLREADVVIFVAEATGRGLTEAIRCYAELKEILAKAGGVPVPVVLQANKLDLPGSLPLETFRERFAGERLLGLVGSSASRGHGVREAFAFAVRLALDRARELDRGVGLARGAPAVQSGAELLSWLEEDRVGAVAPSRADPPDTGRSAEPQEAAEPATPDSTVPSGLVWPPMAGRIVLQELESLAARVVRHSSGSWLGSAGARWRLLSRAGAVFGDLEAGRRLLLEEARRHAELAGVLSEARALVLADTGAGTWRVWHVVRVERSLAHDLHDALLSKDPQHAVAAVCDVALELVRAAHRFQQARPPLLARLGHVAGGDGERRFLGIVPEDPGAERAAGAPETPAALVGRELGPHVAPLLRADPGALLAAFERARRSHDGAPEDAAVVDAVASLLAGR